MKINRCLVLAPHTDDGEFGAGGFISRMIREGVDVYYHAFSAAEQSIADGLPRDILREEIVHAVSHLGISTSRLSVSNYEVRRFQEYRQNILDDMIKLRSMIKPELVLIPSSHDTHQDHKVIYEEGFRAFKRSTLLGYEMLWNQRVSEQTLFVTLNADDIEKKSKSIAEYKSQSHRSYASKEFIYSLSRVRGVQIGEEYCESFEVIRIVV